MYKHVLSLLLVSTITKLYESLCRAVAFVQSLREGGRERGREGGKEGGREGGRNKNSLLKKLTKWLVFPDPVTIVFKIESLR